MIEYLNVCIIPVNVVKLCSLILLFYTATVQIVVSTVVGGINMKYPCYMGKASTECLPRRPFHFYVHMFYVGITRCAAVSVEFCTIAVIFAKMVIGLLKLGLGTVGRSRNLTR